jgi:ParB-like chromosome segregation protein Spo0J|tara:strand:- start:1351 stop:1815 length:465 start_codon:yes stop_codon:yes gene_type:complete
MERVPINSIRNNPINPRLVNTAKFEKLKQSIQDFPQMLELRPIVINEDGFILGGNMRYKALVELGYTEVPVVVAEHITKEQEKEFIIKDNLGFGDWDWDILANEWDSVELEDWGLDVWQNQDDIFANIDDEPNEELKKIVEEDKNKCEICGKLM